MGENAEKEMLLWLVMPFQHLYLVTPEVSLPPLGSGSVSYIIKG